MGSNTPKEVDLEWKGIGTELLEIKMGPQESCNEPNSISEVQDYTPSVCMAGYIGSIATEEIDIMGKGPLKT